jgi:hypothetical protein
MSTDIDYCAICGEELNMCNVVNMNCGHRNCKTCFWKWCETSNACPFCRDEMINRDRKGELELKKTLERRMEIANELDSLYEEERRMISNIECKKRTTERWEKKRKEQRCEIYQNARILERIDEWETNPGIAMNKWHEEQRDFLKASRNLTNIMENNAIRMNMKYCLDEMSLFENSTRGTSERHGRCPILNYNTNPIPRPWLAVGPTLDDMTQEHIPAPMQSPSSEAYFESRTTTALRYIDSIRANPFTEMDYAATSNSTDIAEEALAMGFTDIPYSLPISTGVQRSNNQSPTPNTTRLRVPIRRSRRNRRLLRELR